MFTGIVQSVGTVVSLGDRRLCLDVPEAWPGEPWQIGESLCVDGCCLTVAALGDVLAFDLTEETLSRTTLGSFGVGRRVNLERALRAGDRLGGHIVQGHVDSVGRLVSRNGLFLFSCDDSFAPLLVDKGSVAVNGVSLTVVQPSGGSFGTALVPHTLAVTNLGALGAGDGVNLEFDLFAKYALSPR